MNEVRNSKQYDLEERTLKFSREAITFVKSLPRNISNAEIANQLIRSATSIGANYYRSERVLKQEGLFDEGQDLPQGSQRNHLLAKTR